MAEASSARPRLPPDAGILVDGVRDATGLAILVALESGPGSAAELADHLEIPFDKIRWAFQRLERAQLITFVGLGPGQRGSTARLFETRHAGWRDLATVLRGIATSAVAPP